ncbi:MAG: sugar phosphate isomerase/epimerase [Gemmataceae bacterium]|nr:sugar phosphate isomerase/epimerase [Gemmataceae bacterium]
MIFGYNTNGFVHHRLGDALMILAQLGYQSVAITMDHDALDPFQVDMSKRIARVRSMVQRFGLRCVVETGARFVLDPWNKHQPTLISPKPEQRQQRLDYLGTAVTVAKEFGADALSFWSGTPSDEASAAELMERLVEACKILCESAANFELKLAFEPEPGMFIDSMARFEELHKKVDHPLFGLTLDIGHLHCQGDPIAATLRKWKDVLYNVHIEDMCKGVHEHLMFGEGEINFDEVLATLDEIGYQGGVHVELSRHSHEAVEVARRSLAFLKQAHENAGKK